MKGCVKTHESGKHWQIFGLLREHCYFGDACGSVFCCLCTNHRRRAQHHGCGGQLRPGLIQPQCEHPIPWHFFNADGWLHVGRIRNRDPLQRQWLFYSNFQCDELQHKRCEDDADERAHGECPDGDLCEGGGQFIKRLSLYEHRQLHQGHDGTDWKSSDHKRGCHDGVFDYRSVDGCCGLQ